MSLYDDLGVAASDTKTEGWSKNFKLLQSQLKVKKAALTQAKVGTCTQVSQYTTQVHSKRDKHTRTKATQTDFGVFRTPHVRP